jgi:glycerophosphoryl diester phosphodiesterase
MPSGLTLPKLIAHRGASQIRPENTLIAFEKAHEMGATWIECDVMLTEDDIAIIHHDDTFLRILGLDQHVQQTPYAQIKDMDAGSWFDPTFNMARIPTLAQTLACCAKLNLAMNIELKTPEKYAVNTARKTLALLEAFDFFTPENVLISSITPLALQTVQHIAPHYKLGLISDNWADVEKALTLDLNLYSLNLHHAMITPEKMHALSAQGYRVLSFTVNDPLLAEKQFSMGVTSVFSDNPILLNLGRESK